MKNWDALKQSITPMIPGEGERIPWQWYHRQTYTDNATTTLSFFNAVGVPTTTNMQAAGQIPAPMYFDIYHLGIYFDQITSILAMDDIVNLLDGQAVLSIAQKTYWESMIWSLPAGAGAYGNVDNGTVATAISIAQNGVTDIRARQTFWGDITIPHNQNFSVTLNWAAAVNLVANIDIICFLEGYLYRRVL
jgi:hypothetical protein